MKTKEPKPKALTYSEKLRDPRWQKMRLQIMERDGFKCRECGDQTKTLNVHHRWYEKGKAPWEYDDFALMTLCEECHTGISARLASIYQLAGCLNLRGLRDLDNLIRYTWAPSKAGGAIPHIHFALAEIPHLLRKMHSEPFDGEAVESSISEICRELHYGAVERLAQNAEVEG